MKVLHLISGGDTGGAKTHVFALMNKLKNLADVKIVCFIKGPFWDELQNIGVDCELVEQKNRLDMSVVKRLKEICACGVDIIHCHGARANFIGANLKKKADIPMITTIHSDFLLDFDGIYKKIVYTGLNVYALKKFKYFIGVSSDFKKMLISRNFRPNSVFTVYNGMDYSKIPDYVSKEEFAKRIGLEYDENTTYVGIIGRHDYVKGHDVFVNAVKFVCKECENVKFIIAGDGNNRKSLEALAEKDGVSDKLIFAGFVKDVYSFINFIDINTLTSRSESFPYVLLEGAAMAKPTVCSRVGGIPDLIKEHETGLLFESENSKEFAEKLIFLIKNKDEAEKYGKALKAFAESSFSDLSLAKKHIEIYNSVIHDYKDEKRYDAVISGYYGFKNNGDEALLSAITENLRACRKDVRICVLSARPKETKMKYQADSEPRFNVFALNKAMKNAKMLIFGGGSLIQDATSSKSLLYYLYVLKRAFAHKLTVFVYANGIGPLKDKNLKKVKNALEKADIITLRDELSLEELERMGIDAHGGKNISVTADPAFTISACSDEKVKEIFEKENIPENTEFLCISVRKWHKNDEKFKEKIAMCALYAYEKYSLTPLLLPMRFPHDVEISRDILGLIKEKNAPCYMIKSMYDAPEVMGIVKRCASVLGMRLHTLIYAASSEVPVIGLIYDKKVSGFLEYIGQKRFVSVENVDVDKIKEYLDDIEENREKTVKELSEKKEILYEKAFSNAKKAISALEKAD